MKLSFKPQNITKTLLAALPERSRDVVERRFGLLNKGTKRLTLEAIGQVYGITRERVRQIENSAVDTIRQSDAYDKASGSFDALADAMVSFGGVVHEETFLNALSKDESTQNHINFLLVIGEQFLKLKEDDHFHHRWTTDEEAAEKIHAAIHSLAKDMSKDDLIQEAELLGQFIEILKNEVRDSVSEELASNWLAISKKVKVNPLGDWGLASSPNIRTRGMRDLAYLVLKKEASPLHFSDVASRITDEFNKKAHTATCHNELIKDDRFVLVGRGMYALTEWGYTSGVVRDVIKDILKKNGPLSKDEVIKKVKEQRQVKDNTVYVNLQNANYFKKDSKGKYALV